MLVLAVETSCDETALALIDFKHSRDFKVIAEKISSQEEVHKLYGGVVPELATREHLRNLPLLIDTLWRETGLDFKKIDAMAVTQGPGLKGCLLIGLSYTKAVSMAFDLPLVGVNHIEGHLLAPLMDNRALEFPYLALVVSGGHTELVLVTDFGKYKILARTLDDAAGEAFDKSANLLGFSYPGGPQLAALADQYKSSRFKLPKVMRSSNEFSFSGLKTAIALLIQKNRSLLHEADTRGELAHAIQESIVESLVSKVQEAVHSFGIRNVAITGGVSANKHLRRRVSELSGIKIYFPEFHHCTDNASMIAYAAFPRIIANQRLELNGTALSRWPVEEVNF